eukprot:118626-Rhodomonas_salina.2
MILTSSLYQAQANSSRKSRHGGLGEVGAPQWGGDAGRRCAEAGRRRHGAGPPHQMARTTISIASARE